MDIVETPPHRQPWSSREAVGKILEATPYDKWVSAAEIAAVVGVSPHVVGALIGSCLLGVYVERRRMSPRMGWTYFYRRKPTLHVRSKIRPRPSLSLPSLGLPASNRGSP